MRDNILSADEKRKWKMKSAEKFAEQIESECLIPSRPTVSPSITFASAHCRDLIAVRDAEHARERELAYQSGLAVTRGDIGQLRDEAAEREQAAVAAALNEVATKLDKVADGYATGGHSHRAQMLHGLAEETRSLIQPSQQSALDKLLAEANQEGWQSCLRNIRSSVEGYPDQGGDIEVMTHIQKILVNAKAQVFTLFLDAAAVLGVPSDACTPTLLVQAIAQHAATEAKREMRERLAAMIKKFGYGPTAPITKAIRAEPLDAPTEAERR